MMMGVSFMGKFWLDFRFSHEGRHHGVGVVPIIEIGTYPTPCDWHGVARGKGTG
jgi:hypothetical protein